MATTDEWLSVNDALDVLRLNGVEISRAALSMAIVRGTIKSEKIFSARVISRHEIARVIAERRSRREATGK